MIESQDYSKSTLDALIASKDRDVSSSDSDLISKKLKIWFLFIICITGIGSYFCYDNPGALEKQLMDVKSI